MKPEELADELERLAPIIGTSDDLLEEAYPITGKFVALFQANLPVILSALRDGEKMRAAVKVADHDLTTTHNLRATDLNADQLNEALNRGVPLSDLEWMTDNSRGLAALRSALTGEGQ